MLGVGLLAASAGASLIGGMLGKSRASKQARIQGRISGLQNQVYAEQAQQQRDNLLLQRRQQFRQESAALAGSRVAAAASGMTRSSGFSSVQQSIRQKTSENVGRINRAMASGERISGLNEQIADLGGQAAEASVPTTLETVVGVGGQFAGQAAGIYS